jgi:hypothetical protein
MVAEYHFPLAYVLGTDPRHYLRLEAGLALLDARRERRNPGSVIGYVADAVSRAREEVRHWYEARYTIVPEAEYRRLMQEAAGHE